MKRWFVGAIWESRADFSLEAESAEDARAIVESYDKEEFFHNAIDNDPTDDIRIEVVEEEEDDESVSK